MSGEDRPRSRGKVTAVAVLISVFMAGGLTAAAVIQVVRAADGAPEAGTPSVRPRGGMGPGMGQGMGPGAGPMRGGGPGLAPMAMSRRMSQRLGLDQRQEEAIREILDRRHRVSDSIMRRVAPELRAQIDSMQAEIRRVLRPEQRERFDRLREEGREALFRRFPGGG